MANAKQYYKYPFADNGNYDDVPDQASGGVVDYESGYGPDYEKAVGVEGRKRIDRTSFNGVLHALTDNVKQWQERNFPTWIEDDGSSDPAVPFSYDADVVVYHDSTLWSSLVDGNSDEPSLASAKWKVYEPNKLYDDTGSNEDAAMTQKAITDSLQEISDNLQIISDSLIGIGQTWQNVSSSRANGATYTNNTGRTITVMTSFRDGGSGSSFFMQVDGITFSSTPDFDGDNPVNTTLLVPPNSTYRVSWNNNIKISWLELR